MSYGVGADVAQSERDKRHPRREGRFRVRGHRLPLGSVTAATRPGAETRGWAVATLLVLAAFGVLPPGVELLGVRAALALAAAVLAALCWHRRASWTPVAMVTAVLLALLTAGVFWTVALALAAAFLAVVRRWDRQIDGLSMARGRLPIWEIFACAAVTPVALTGWVVVFDPDVSDLVESVPRVSAVLLILGALAFAVLNAVFEEWLWRGLIQPQLTASFGCGLAIVLQAVSFGVAHTWGFPRGAAGVVLVTVWALMLGALRQRSGGLAAPVLAHVVADATIAVLVLTWWS